MYFASRALMMNKAYAHKYAISPRLKHGNRFVPKLVTEILWDLRSTLGCIVHVFPNLFAYFGAHLENRTTFYG